jgi:hypothetical protein
MARLGSGRIGSTCGKAGDVEINRCASMQEIATIRQNSLNALFGREFGVFDFSGWALDLGVVLS